MKKSGKITLAGIGITSLVALGVLWWKKEHQKVHERHEQELKNDLDILGDNAEEVLSDEEEEEETDKNSKSASMPTKILKTIWHSNLPVFGESDNLMKVYANYYYGPDKDNYSSKESFKKALDYWEDKYDKLVMFDHSLHILIMRDPNHLDTKYLRFMFRIRPYHHYGDPTLSTYHTFMKDFATGFWRRNKLVIAAPPRISNELWAGREDPVYETNKETGESILDHYEVVQFKLQPEDYSNYSQNENDAMSKMASAFHGLKTSLGDLQHSGEDREDWCDLGLYVCADFQVRYNNKRTDFDILMAIKFLQEFIENGKFKVNKLVFHPGPDLGVFLDPESGYDENTIMLAPDPE